MYLLSYVWRGNKLIEKNLLKQEKRRQKEQIDIMKRTFPFIKNANDILFEGYFSCDAG